MVLFAQSFQLLRKLTLLQIFTFFVNRKVNDDCPVPVVSTNLQDKITYFSEAILEKSTGKKSFFENSLAGLTLENTPSGVHVRSWFSNQVNVEKFHF